MTYDLQLEVWLGTATENLAPESIAQVHAEIREHYESALADGRTPEEALQSLGNPRRANRQYRRVLLTDSEARWAPRPAVPIAPLRLDWTWYLYWGAVIVWWPNPRGPHLNLWFLGAIMLVSILRDRFLLSESVNKHCRRAAFLLWAAWFCWPADIHDWLPAMCLFLGYGAAVFLYKRRIRRKLSGQATFVLDLARDATAGRAFTANESLFLRMMERESKRAAWSFCLRHLPAAAGFVLGVFMLIHAAHGKHPEEGRYAGVVFVTFFAAWLVDALSSRDALLTPERGPRFRLVKWTMLAIAGLAPPLASWMLGRAFWDSRDVGTGFTVMSYGFLVLASSWEYMRVKLRRKLPESQWPGWLYL